MKVMFLYKRSRLDINPGIIFLSSRVTVLTEQDWNKLIRIIKFLKQSKKRF